MIISKVKYLSFIFLILVSCRNSTDETMPEKLPLAKFYFPKEKKYFIVCDDSSVMRQVDSNKIVFYEEDLKFVIKKKNHQLRKIVYGLLNRGTAYHIISFDSIQNVVGKESTFFTVIEKKDTYKLTQHSNHYDSMIVVISGDTFRSQNNAVSIPSKLTNDLKELYVKSISPFEIDTFKGEISSGKMIAEFYASWKLLKLIRDTQCKACN